MIAVKLACRGFGCSLVGCCAVWAALVPGGLHAAEQPRHFAVTTAEELVKAAGHAQGGGCTITLAPGVYVVDQPLVFNKANQTRIEGSGWNTIIRRKGSGNLLEFVDSGFCEIRDLLLEADRQTAAGSGIVFRGSSSCTVDFRRIDGFPESGVRFEGDPKAPMSSNTVSRCHFIGNRQDQLYSRANNDFYILQNQFGTHGGTPISGCRLDHSSAGTYSMNYHWGNVVALRLGPGANFNRIQNNRFEQSRQTGLLIGIPEGGDGSIFNIIAGNTFHTNSEGDPGKYPAVEAYDAVETTFTGNQTFSWSSDKVKHSSSLILGRGCWSWIVKDNILRHNTGKALVYDAASGHLIKDNLVDDGKGG